MVLRGVICDVLSMGVICSLLCALLAPGNAYRDTSKETLLEDLASPMQNDAHQDTDCNIVIPPRSDTRSMPMTCE